MNREGRLRQGNEPLDAEKAWNYALTLLTRRAHTEAEISERLARRRAPQGVIDDILSRLRRYQLVDDEAFAESFVRSHSPRKGSLALRRDLLRKGVPEEITEESLVELDEVIQAETAGTLLDRNAWRFRGPDGRRNRARAFAFLARRGFPVPVVLDALDHCEWLGAEPEEGQEDG